MKKSVLLFSAVAILLGTAFGVFVLLGSLTGVVTSKTFTAAELTLTWCSVATSQPGGYVMIWDLYGTPTATPQRGAILPTATFTPISSSGDPVKGRDVFFTVAQCSACHIIDQDVVLVGPSLMGIASRAGQKRNGWDAADYVRSVIQNPLNVVPSSKPGVMPVNYTQTLSEQQIEDVVAFLLTLQ